MGNPTLVLSIVTFLRIHEDLKLVANQLGAYTRLPLHAGVSQSRQGSIPLAQSFTAALANPTMKIRSDLGRIAADLIPDPN